MQFNLEKIPFSAYGSFFACSVHWENKDVYVRDLHGGDEAPSYVYRVIPECPEEYEILHYGTELILAGRVTGWRIRFVMGEKDTLYIKTEGTGVSLQAEGGSYDTLLPLSVSVYEHHLSTMQIKIKLTCLTGSITGTQEWNVRGSKNAGILISADSEAVMESYRAVSSGLEYLSFAEAKKQQEISFGKWEKSFSGTPGRFEDSRQLAAYITWMNFVHKGEQLTADAMYMSKNWMNNIWSWDNCFAGIALSAAHPELAYGQMKIFMDTQAEAGCYPDYVNETFASYSFVKPPIHAWAYEKMMSQNPELARPEKAEKMYRSLCSMTDYWFRYRGNENSVFPMYCHGNDSGWDNASVFRKGMPVESPDLAAFLIYQMDALSRMAEMLGKQEEAGEWEKQADEWYSRFTDRFLENGRFYARYVPTGEKLTEGDSLLMYLPLIIGYRFGKELTAKLTGDLLERFETPFGLATEAPGSPFYKKGGYWLGPVWAPTTYLFIDILRANGYLEDAARIAEKFCRLTQTGLMSENYDPYTGEGYDDPAFSWPSCVLLQLLKESEKSAIEK